MTLDDLLARGDAADCVTNAHDLAQLLLDRGRDPWIAQIHDITIDGDRITYGPLNPQRFRHRTWSRHFLCCSDGLVYDPFAGEPLPLATYAETVFGRPLALREFLSTVETARRLRDGTFRQAFRPPFS